MSSERPPVEVGRLYKPEEVAAILGIDPGTVRRWIRRKVLPAHKIGRLWFVSAADLLPGRDFDKSDKSE